MPLTRFDASKKKDEEGYAASVTITEPVDDSVTSQSAIATMEDGEKSTEIVTKNPAKQLQNLATRYEGQESRHMTNYSADVTPRQPIVIKEMAWTQPKNTIQSQRAAPHVHTVSLQSGNALNDVVNYSPPNEDVNTKDMGTIGHSQFLTAARNVKIYLRTDDSPAQIVGTVCTRGTSDLYFTAPEIAVFSMMIPSVNIKLNNKFRQIGENWGENDTILKATREIMNGHNKLFSVPDSSPVSYKDFVLRHCSNEIGKLCGQRKILLDKGMPVCACGFRSMTPAVVIEHVRQNIYLRRQFKCLVCNCVAGWIGAMLHLKDCCKDDSSLIEVYVGTLLAKILQDYRYMSTLSQRLKTFLSLPAYIQQLHQHTVFSTSAVLDLTRVLLRGETYDCNKCGLHTNVPDIFFEHLRCHLLQLPYGCSLCTSRFRSPDKFSAHICKHGRREMTVDETANDTINAIFRLCANKQSPTTKSIFYKEDRFRCWEDGFVSTMLFSTLQHFMQHTNFCRIMKPLSSISYQQGLFTCNDCSLKTKLVVLFREHLRCHFLDRPYRCASCAENIVFNAQHPCGRLAIVARDSPMVEAVMKDIYPVPRIQGKPFIIVLRGEGSSVCTVKVNEPTARSNYILVPVTPNRIQAKAGSSSTVSVIPRIVNIQSTSGSTVQNVPNIVTMSRGTNDAVTLQASFSRASQGVVVPQITGHQSTSVARTPGAPNVIRIATPTVPGQARVVHTAESRKKEQIVPQSTFSILKRKSNVQTTSISNTQQQANYIPIAPMPVTIQPIMAALVNTGAASFSPLTNNALSTTVVSSASTQSKPVSSAQAFAVISLDRATGRVIHRENYPVSRAGLQQSTVIQLSQKEKNPRVVSQMLKSNVSTPNTVPKTGFNDIIYVDSDEHESVVNATEGSTLDSVTRIGTAETTQKDSDFTALKNVIEMHENKNEHDVIISFEELDTPMEAEKNETDTKSVTSADSDVDLILVDEDCPTDTENLENSAQNQPSQSEDNKNLDSTLEKQPSVEISGTDCITDSASEEQDSARKKSETKHVTSQREEPEDIIRSILNEVAGPEVIASVNIWSDGTESHTIKKSNISAGKEDTVELNTEEKDKDREDSMELKKDEREKHGEDSVELGKDGTEKHGEESVELDKDGTEKHGEDFVELGKDGTEKHGEDSVELDKDGTEKHGEDSVELGKDGTEKHGEDSVELGKDGKEKDGEEFGKDAKDSVESSKEVKEKNGEDTVELNKEGKEKHGEDSMELGKDGTEKHGEDSVELGKDGTEKHGEDSVELGKDGKEKDGEEFVEFSNEGKEKDAVYLSKESKETDHVELSKNETKDGDSLEFISDGNGKYGEYAVELTKEKKENNSDTGEMNNEVTETSDPLIEVVDSEGEDSTPAIVIAEVHGGAHQDWLASSGRVTSPNDLTYNASPNKQDSSLSQSHIVEGHTSNIVANGQGPKDGKQNRGYRRFTYYCTEEGFECKNCKFTRKTIDAFEQHVLGDLHGCSVNKMPSCPKCSHMQDRKFCPNYLRVMIGLLHFQRQQATSKKPLCMNVLVPTYKETELHELHDKTAETATGTKNDLSKNKKLNTVFNVSNDMENKSLQDKVSVYCTETGLGCLRCGYHSSELHSFHDHLQRDIHQHQNENYVPCSECEKIKGVLICKKVLKILEHLLEFKQKRSVRALQHQLACCIICGKALAVGVSGSLLLTLDLTKCTAGETVVLCNRCRVYNNIIALETTDLNSIHNTTPTATEISNVNNEDSNFVTNGYIFMCKKCKFNTRNVHDLRHHIALHFHAFYKNIVVLCRKCVPIGNTHQCPKVCSVVDRLLQQQKKFHELLRNENRTEKPKPILPRTVLLARIEHDHCYAVDETVDEARCRFSAAGLEGTESSQASKPHLSTLLGASPQEANQRAWYNATTEEYIRSKKRRSSKSPASKQRGKKDDYVAESSSLVKFDYWQSMLRCQTCSFVTQNILDFKGHLWMHVHTDISKCHHVSGGQKKLRINCPIYYGLIQALNATLAGRSPAKEPKHLYESQFENRASDTESADSSGDETSMYFPNGVHGDVGSKTSYQEFKKYRVPVQNLSSRKSGSLQQVTLTKEGAKMAVSRLVLQFRAPAHMRKAARQRTDDESKPRKRRKGSKWTTMRRKEQWLRTSALKQYRKQYKTSLNTQITKPGVKTKSKRLFSADLKSAELCSKFLTPEADDLVSSYMHLHRLCYTSTQPVCFMSIHPVYKGNDETLGHAISELQCWLTNQRMPHKSQFFTSPQPVRKLAHDTGLPYEFVTEWLKMHINKSGATEDGGELSQQLLQEIRINYNEDGVGTLDKTPENVIKSEEIVDMLAFQDESDDDASTSPQYIKVETKTPSSETKYPIPSPIRNPLNTTSPASRQIHFEEPSREEREASSRKLSCPRCSFFAWSKAQIESHVMWHAIDVTAVDDTGEEMAFSCPECPCKVASLSDLKFHLQFHYGDDQVKYFQCGSCSYKTTRESSMEQHHKESHTSMPESITCSDDTSYVVKNIRVPFHHGTYRCPFDTCSVALSHIIVLQEHCVREHGQPLADAHRLDFYTGPVDKTMIGEVELPVSEDEQREDEEAKLQITRERMQKRPEKGARSYKCTHCICAFYTPRNLKRHLKLKHPALLSDVNKNSDAIKPRQAIDLIKIEGMVEVSSEEATQELECDYCSYEPPTMQDLQQHLMNMHGVNNDATSLLPRQLPDKDSVSQAPKNEHGSASSYSESRDADATPIGESTQIAERYECTICGHWTRQEPIIRRHVMMHLSYCPYQCPLCYVKSVRSSHITSHLASVHSNRNLIPTVIRDDAMESRLNSVIKCIYSNRPIKPISDSQVAIRMSKRDGSLRMNQLAFDETGVSSDDLICTDDVVCDDYVDVVNDDVSSEQNTDSYSKTQSVQGKSSTASPKGKQARRRYACLGKKKRVKKPQSESVVTKYTCKLCAYKVKTNFVRMRVHVMQHFEYVPYKCPVCDFTTSVYSKCRNHITRVHGLQFGVPMYNKDRKLEAKVEENIQVDEVPDTKSSASPAMVAKQQKAPSSDVGNADEAKSQTASDYKVTEAAEDTRQINKGDAKGLHVPVGSIDLKKKTSTQKKYSCKICGVISDRIDTAIGHVMSHLDYRPYKCPKCTYTSTWKNSCIKHIRSSHRGIKRKPRYVKNVWLQDQVRKNIKIEETNIEADDVPKYKDHYYCSKCVFKTYHVSRMRDHVMMHIGYRPVTCPKCCHRTVTRGHMTNHLFKAHSTDPEYRNMKPVIKLDPKLERLVQKELTKASKGEITKIDFTRIKYTRHKDRGPNRDSDVGDIPGLKTEPNVNSEMHQSTTNELQVLELNRKFKCKLCPYTSNGCRDVRFHIMEHIGYEPYKCPVCQYTACRPSRCLTHIKRKHVGEKLKPIYVKDNHLDNEVDENILRLEETNGSAPTEKQPSPSQQAKTPPNMNPVVLIRKEKFPIPPNIGNSVSVLKKDKSLSPVKPKAESSPGKKEKTPSPTKRRSPASNKRENRITERKTDKTKESTSEKDSSGIWDSSLLSKQKQRFLCNYCDHSTVGKMEYMKLHVMAHLNYRPMRCPFCKARYARNHGILRHMRMKHRGCKGEPIICSNPDMDEKVMNGFKVINADQAEASANLDDQENSKNAVNNNEGYSYNVKDNNGVDQSVEEDDNDVEWGHDEDPIDDVERSSDEKDKQEARSASGSETSMCARYVCDKCSFSIDSYGDMRTHVMDHLKYKPYKCPICNMMSSSFSTIQQHITYAHKDEKSIPLVQTKAHLERKIFEEVMNSIRQVGKTKLSSKLKAGRDQAKKSSKNKRKSPDKVTEGAASKIRTVRGKDNRTGDTKTKLPSPNLRKPRTYACSQCHFGTVYQGVWKRHVMIHLGYGKYKCPLCRYKSTNGYSVKAHLLSAHKTDSQSPICAVDEKLEKELEQKMKDWNNIRPGNNQQTKKQKSGKGHFTCVKCGFYCLQRGKMVQHLRAEISYKPFGCAHCNFVSSTVGQTVQHTLRRHRGKRRSPILYSDAKKERKLMRLLKAAAKSPEREDEDPVTKKPHADTNMPQISKRKIQNLEEFTLIQPKVVLSKIPTPAAETETHCTDKESNESVTVGMREEIVEQLEMVTELDDLFTEDDVNTVHTEVVHTHQHDRSEVTAFDETPVNVDTDCRIEMSPDPSAASQYNVPKLDSKVTVQDYFSRLGNIFENILFDSEPVESIVKSVVQSARSFTSTDDMPESQQHTVAKETERIEIPNLMQPAEEKICDLDTQNAHQQTTMSPEHYVDKQVRKRVKIVSPKPLQIIKTLKSSDESKSVAAQAERFQCSRCKFTTTRRDNIRRHVMKHINYRPFKCSLCSFAAWDISNTQRHVRKPHAGSKAKVVILKSSKSERRVQKGFIKICEPSDQKQKFSPVRSPPMSPISGGFRNAVRKYSGNIVYKCVNCLLETRYFTSIFRHLVREMEYLRYRCVHCPFKAHCANDVKSHCRSAHKGESLESVVCKEEIQERRLISLIQRSTVRKSPTKRAPQPAEPESVKSRRLEPEVIAESQQSYFEDVIFERTPIQIPRADASTGYRQCAFCRYKTCDVTDIKSHVLLHAPPHWRCDGCNAEFRLLKRLNKHLAYAHRTLPHNYTNIVTGEKCINGIKQENCDKTHETNLVKEKDASPSTSQQRQETSADESKREEHVSNAESLLDSVDESTEDKTVSQRKRKRHNESKSEKKRRKSLKIDSKTRRSLTPTGVRSGKELIDTSQETIIWDTSQETVIYDWSDASNAMVSGTSNLSATKLKYINVQPKVDVEDFMQMSIEKLHSLLCGYGLVNINY